LDTDLRPDDLTAEDLDSVGYRRVGDSWSSIGRSIDREIAAEKSTLVFKADPPARQRRARKPSLESQVRSLGRASKAAGVAISLTIERGVVTASPSRGQVPQVAEFDGHSASPRALFTADPDLNEWDADLGIQTPSLRQ
jgi:hypothetical protein